MAYHVEAAEYVDTTGRRTSSLDYDQFARLAGGKVLSLLRPDMERAALAALEDVASGRVRICYGAQSSRVWPGNGEGMTDRDARLDGVERVAGYLRDGMPPIAGRVLLMICEPAEQSAAEIA